MIQMLAVMQSNIAIPRVTHLHNAKIHTQAHTTRSLAVSANQTIFPYNIIAMWQEIFRVYIHLGLPPSCLCIQCVVLVLWLVLLLHW